MSEDIEILENEGDSHFKTPDRAMLKASESWDLVTSYSAEATAAFLGGNSIGRPQIHDPLLRDRMAAQEAALRAAIYGRVIPALIESLEGESRSSARRLGELARFAQAGHAEPNEQLLAMLGELLKNGLGL
jgi:hypothetical protein